MNEWPEQISQKMPEHFKPNFLYRHIWNNVWKRDMNATFVIVGTPGKGKSTLALKICEDIDPTFTPERVCYSVEDMVQLLAKKGENPVRDNLISHSENGTFAIREGNWKLIVDNKTSGGWVEPAGDRPQPDTPGQLYDLASDPYETEDLWERRPDIVKRLTLLLEKYKEDGRSAPFSPR